VGVRGACEAFYEGLGKESAGRHKVCEGRGVRGVGAGVLVGWPRARVLQAFCEALLGAQVHPPSIERVAVNGPALAEGARCGPRSLLVAGS